MGDVGEDYKEHKRRSIDKRAYNRENSARILDEHGVRWISKNDGIHLMVDGPVGIIDFWPGTGKWRCRSGVERRGVFRLLKYLGK